MRSPRSLVRWAFDWPVESQLQARRNALRASTALAQVRYEREAVDEFLAALSRSPETPPRDAEVRARRG